MHYKISMIYRPIKNEELEKHFLIKKLKIKTKNILLILAIKQKICFL